MITVLASLTVGEAAAAPAPVAVDDRSPELGDAKDDGTRSVGLAFTNLTDSPLQLVAEAKDATDEGCSVFLTPTTLPPAEKTPIDATVAAGCAVDDDGFNFAVHVIGTPIDSKFDITAAPAADDSKPAWSSLLVFPILLAALLVVVFLLWATWRGAPGIRDTLDNLDSGWSLKESWASNVTAIAAVLTGVFGSTDIATALLGDDAEKSIALAIVGAAVATGFVAAGPVVLNAIRGRKKVDPAAVDESAAADKKKYPLVGGLLAATAVTLTGAFGELFIMWRTAMGLDMAGWEDRAWIPAVAAAILLAVYGFTSTVETIEVGTAEPPAATPSDVIKAATMIAVALREEEPSDFEVEVTQMAARYPGILTSPGDERRARRSAVL